MQPIRPTSPSTIRTQDLNHAATTTAAGAGAPVRPDSAGATAGARQAAIDTAPPTTDLRATLSRLNARLGEVQSKDAAAQSADAALEQVGALLDDIATETRRASTSGGDLAASRAKIDELLEQVRVAAGDAARSPVPPSPLASRLSYVSSDVPFIYASATLAPGESFTGELEVVQPGEPAVVYLSLGQDNVNLASASDRFRLEITGPYGPRELSFASGTSIAEIARRISFEPGVIATLSDNGISQGVRIESQIIGAEALLSVRVIDDGGLNNIRGVGVYRTLSENSLAADPSTRASFAALEASGAPVSDAGRDLRARLNGVDADVQAFHPEWLVQVEGDGWRAFLGLSRERARIPGSFVAFTLAPTARVGEGADATREQDSAITQVARLDGPSLLGGGSGALDLLSLAKGEAAAERERIAEFRKTSIRPELASLTDQVTAAMLGRAANAGRPPAAELTPERAAALLRGRTGG